MKMILAIVNADDAAKVTAALIEHGHRVTRIATEGGWLRRQNATLLLGVDDDKVNDVAQVLKDSAAKRTTQIYMTSEGAGALPFNVETGGATFFVLNVERLESV